MAISFTKNNGAFRHQAQHDPEEFFRLGRFAVRRKVDFCKIGVPKFSENQDFFGPQTDLSAKILLEIFVYLKSPSPVNKKTMAFSLTRLSAIRSLCTSNRLRLRTKKQWRFPLPKQWRFPSPGPARSRRIFPLRSVCGPQESRFL